jgi:hypothetical protein
VFLTTAEPSLGAFRRLLRAVEQHLPFLPSLFPCNGGYENRHGDLANLCLLKLLPRSQSIFFRLRGLFMSCYRHRIQCAPLFFADCLKVSSLQRAMVAMQWLLSQVVTSWFAGVLSWLCIGDIASHFLLFAVLQALDNRAKLPWQCRDHICTFQHVQNIRLF